MKTMEIIKKNIEISEMIKKHFELDFLKKLLLNENEQKLFPYQFKYLNLQNLEPTKKFLNLLLKKDFYELNEPEKEKSDK